MIFFAIQRLIASLFTLFILATLTFFLIRLAPGGPFDSDRAWPAEIEAHIKKVYELDLPVATQYRHWLSSAMHGDLRESFQYLGRPVSEILGDSIPVSLQLGSIALLLAIAIGIPLGCVAAWKRGSIFDYSAVFIAVSGISLPTYLVASALIFIFAYQLEWLPPALWETPQSMLLPVVTLASRPLAVIARLTRTAMLDVLQADYIRTANAAGVHPTKIVFRHALRNSLVPVISILGPTAAQLITGSFLVEIMYQIPGVGKHFVTAVLNRDYPMVMGVTLFYALVLIFSNWCVDLLYGWVDPRIRVYGDRA